MYWLKYYFVFRDGRPSDADVALNLPLTTNGIEVNAGGIKSLVLAVGAFDRVSSHLK